MQPIFFPNPNNLEPVKFMNPQNIMDYNFQEMIDKMITSQEKTDDYELRKMIKHILAKDYYQRAKEWLYKFGDAEWWREDLIITDSEDCEQK